MVIMLDGYLEHVAHARWKKCLFGKNPIETALSIKSNAFKNQITEIEPYVRTYISVTIKCKNHDYTVVSYIVSKRKFLKSEIKKPQLLEVA